MENIESVRKNFKEQLDQVDKRISELTEELKNVSEYRLKLMGGLETIDLLSPPEEDKEEAVTPEVVAES
jgi:hypothetical protein